MTGSKSQLNNRALLKTQKMHAKVYLHFLKHHNLKRKKKKSQEASLAL